MRFLLLFLVFLLANCSKPKTVLICGDHICVNKKEAEQFFEENLSLEVKIIDKKIKEEKSLVELNLKDNNQGKKEIKIFAKKNTKNEIKPLSNKEKVKIKEIVKKKEIKKKKVKKESIKENKNELKQLELKKDEKINQIKKRKQIINNEVVKNNVNNNTNTGIDICSILKKCDIDEISKYLINAGMNKNYPDITARQ